MLAREERRYSTSTRITLVEDSPAKHSGLVVITRSWSAVTASNPVPLKVQTLAVNTSASKQLMAQSVQEHAGEEHTSIL
jgi:hypothetical protein